MTTKQNNTGELSDQQLDDVSGGQQVVKMEKIVVTAKRSDAAPPQQVVKMDKVVVTARRDTKEPADIGGAQIAQADTNKK